MYHRYKFCKHKCSKSTHFFDEVQKLLVLFLFVVLFTKATDTSLIAACYIIFVVSIP